MQFASLCLALFHLPRAYEASWSPCAAAHRSPACLPAQNACSASRPPSSFASVRPPALFCRAAADPTSPPPAVAPSSCFTTTPPAACLPVLQATLGRVDTVHLMLLGLILVVFSLAALWALWLAELRMRDAWLERRRRRGAATIDNNLEDCTNGCSGGASPASPAMESEPAAATPGEGPSPSTAAVIMAAEGAPAEAGAAG